MKLVVAQGAAELIRERLQNKRFDRAWPNPAAYAIVVGRTVIDHGVEVFETADSVDRLAGRLLPRSWSTPPGSAVHLARLIPGAALDGVLAPLGPGSAVATAPDRARRSVAQACLRFERTLGEVGQPVHAEVRDDELLLLDSDGTPSGHAIPLDDDGSFM